MSNVSPEYFISAWESANSVEQVAQTTGLNKAACCSRAGAYRAKGIELKRFPRGRSRLNVESLAMFAESLKASPIDPPEELGNLVRA